jgi:hypothetical protein
MLSLTPPPQSHFELSSMSSGVVPPSAKTEFLNTFLNPLWDEIKAEPEKVFLNLYLIEENITSLLACSEATFFWV